MSMQLYSPSTTLMRRSEARAWAESIVSDQPAAANDMERAADMVSADMATGDMASETVQPSRLWYLPIKTTVDFVAALVLLVILGPVMVVAALATRLGSKGPAFYKQTRLGRGGREFRIWKIRTMRHNAESSTGAVWSQENDPRVTKLGRFLRASHIDEFPQLFQVLTGEMSLIGPRPERPEFVHHLQWQVPRYAERLAVKPGVTGLAQMLLPPDSDTEGVRRKVQCDLYYVRHLGPALDTQIVLQTAWTFAKSLAEAAVLPFRLPNSEVVQRQVAEICDG